MNVHISIWSVFSSYQNLRRFALLFFVFCFGMGGGGMRVN